MHTKEAIQLFHQAVKDIPAYQKFLANEHFDPASVVDETSFKQIPLITKKNYLTQFDLNDLTWPGERRDLMLFSTSSGSTGEPYNFPRDNEISRRYSTLLEPFIKQSSYGPGKTLFIIGFGMGVWIAGVATLRALEMVAERTKQPTTIAILPTGYNKTEIFKALRNLSPQFDQTVIMGYPPFIKELIDEAAEENIDLKKLSVRIVLGAEACTEAFRDYICQQAGVSNVYLDSMNIYGTTEVGALACETPLTVLLRRLAARDTLLFGDMFGQTEKTPTLAQYNSDHLLVESVDSQLVLTTDGVLPLMRYAIGDVGGVFNFSEIVRLLNHYGIDLDREMRLAKINKRLINRNLPFVYVYERADFSVTLHGLNIYPEFIKEALLQPALAGNLTVRFTMSTKFNKHHDQYLEINLELQRGIEPSTALETIVLKQIIKTLIQKSSEFAEVARNHDPERLIRLNLLAKNQPPYFAPGTKHHWVEKSADIAMAP